MTIMSKILSVMLLSSGLPARTLRNRIQAVNTFDLMNELLLSPCIQNMYTSGEWS